MVPLGVVMEGQARTLSISTTTSTYGEFKLQYFFTFFSRYLGIYHIGVGQIPSHNANSTNISYWLWAAIDICCNLPNSQTSKSENATKVNFWGRNGADALIWANFPWSFTETPFQGLSELGPLGQKATIPCMTKMPGPFEWMSTETKSSYKLQDSRWNGVTSSFNTTS